MSARIIVLLGVLGIITGLFIGWVISPKYKDTDPSSLQQAYKDEYVLMIATAYAGDGDLAAARERLAALGYSNPGRAVAETAQRMAQAGGYSPGDLERVAALAAALGERVSTSNTAP